MLITFILYCFYYYFFNISHVKSNESIWFQSDAGSSCFLLPSQWLGWIEMMTWHILVGLRISVSDAAGEVPVEDLDEFHKLSLNSIVRPNFPLSFPVYTFKCFLKIYTKFTYILSAICWIVTECSAMWRCVLLFLSLFWSLLVLGRKSLSTEITFRQALTKSWFSHFDVKLKKLNRQSNQYPCVSM